MKTMKDFSAFKLNKNQMSAMKGGKITCLVIYNDELGGSFSMTFERADDTLTGAKEVMEEQHPEASKVDCYTN